MNVDITAPAAILALGLMYLRTNNVAVGEQLDIPVRSDPGGAPCLRSHSNSQYTEPLGLGVLQDTHFLLDYVRPDFILLRVLARNLVLWDSIVADEAWVESHVPAMITAALKIEACSDEEDEDEDIDFEAVRHAHWNIIAAVCLSIGLRFAGQANLQAQQLLLKYISFFQGCARSGGSGEISVGKPTAIQPFQSLATEPPGFAFAGCGISKLDKPIMETCFDVVVLSLCLIMAGTGNLDTLRLLRESATPLFRPYSGGAPASVVAI